MPGSLFDDQELCAINISSQSAFGYNQMFLLFASITFKDVIITTDLRPSQCLFNNTDIIEVISKLDGTPRQSGAATA